MFDKHLANEFTREAIAMLAPLAAKHNVTLTAAGGTFDPIEFTMKLTAKMNDKQAVADQAHNDFNRNARAFGLVETDFGARFTYNMKSWELCGLLPSRPKYCVQAKELGTGKVMLLSRTALPKIIAARGSAPAAQAPGAGMPAPRPASTAFAGGSMF